MFYLFIPVLNQIIDKNFRGPAIPTTILAFVLGILVSIITYTKDEKTEDEIIAIVMEQRSSNN